MGNAEERYENEKKQRRDAYKKLQDARAEYNRSNGYTDGTTIRIGEEFCHFVVGDRDEYSGQITGACEIWYKGETCTQISELEELFNDLWVALQRK